MKIVVALLACGLAAQAQPWDALRGLKPSERLKVFETAGVQHNGLFADVSENSLSLNTGHAVIQIERARIRRVQVRSSSRRLRNLLIGVGIGTAVGIAVDQTVGTYLRNETGDSYRALTYVAPVALCGAIGAAIPAYRMVYRAP